jgi:hypothetical protein
MSETENNKPEKSDEDRKFWLDPRARNVFNLFVQGKSIDVIVETLNMKRFTVENMMINRFFVAKLETYLRGIMFTNQVAKVIAAADVFSKLWDRVNDNLADIPPEICLKELTKLFPQKREGVIINPKHMSVFMKVMKDSNIPEELGQRLLDVDENMGYDGLKEDPEAVYPELGESPIENGEQQGDHSMDPGQPSKDEQGAPN